MNRDGYPMAWVRLRADRAMAPIFHRLGPPPGQPIPRRTIEARYGPRYDKGPGTASAAPGPYPSPRREPSR